MCGARTVEISRNILGNGGEKFRKLRLKRGLAEYHLRVIVSGSGSINPRAEIFKKRFSPIIIFTTARISKADLKKLLAVADEVKICGKREINFPAALRWLREKWNVKRLLCEGGGELNGALFRAGLVDELHLTICPKIFGGRNAPTIADGTGFARWRAQRFKSSIQAPVGDEYLPFLPATVVKNSDLFTRLTYQLSPVCHMAGGCQWLFSGLRLLRFHPAREQPQQIAQRFR